ncbi:hypothetical protein G6F32_014118 [Rhizopus arrhizus]|nr:hypothetical protein G6F32_014118 [Rhizopus arrhizus]
MRAVQVGCIYPAQRFAEGAAQLAGVDHAGRAAENPVLFDAVGGAAARAREHEFPVDADALGLVGIADAQRAALALCELAQSLLGQVQLRQHAIGHRQQGLPGLGQAQAAAFAQPDIGTELLLQLLHAVAERRLGQVEDAGSGGQRALLLDLLHDAEVDPLQHDDESRSWIGEVIPFYVMEGHG